MPAPGAASPLTAALRAPLEIDLTKVTIPVLAINGEYDRPYAKTFRMWRELRDFTSVILPGKSHLTAIAVESEPPGGRLDAAVQVDDAAASAYDVGQDLTLEVVRGSSDNVQVVEQQTGQGGLAAATLAGKGEDLRPRQLERK